MKSFANTEAGLWAAPYKLFWGQEKQEIWPFWFVDVHTQENFSILKVKDLHANQKKWKWHRQLYVTIETSWAHSC